MTTEELRVKAHQLGLKVSELEEQQALVETIEASRTSEQSMPKDIIEQVVKLSSEEVSAVAAFPKAHSTRKIELEEDDDAQYFDKDSVLFKPRANQNIHSNNNNVVPELSELVEEGGKWHTLPYEMVDRILMFLGDIDMMGYLAITSRTTFQPSEVVYEYLCRITYPMQTAKKTLQVENWLNWKNMLIHRPRLRTNGFYTLRTMYSKGYCNDNFWEEKQYKSVEVKYYRHMRFLDHGRMFYSLDIVEPTDMAKWMATAAPLPKRIFEGRYTIVRREVTVEVPLHYCNMRFVMILLDGDDGYEGKCNMLRLISHSSTPLPRRTPGQNNNHHNINHHQHHGHPAEPAAVHRVEYTLPQVADLRFHRFWNFSSRQLPVR